MLPHNSISAFITTCDPGLFVCDSVVLLFLHLFILCGGLMFLFLLVPIMQPIQVTGTTAVLI